ncbi:MAG: DUF1134 domain-containing protein [Hyphomicrobiales bacterium]|nr:DUF1134 domain-containing protein [Hyphomicrobiales bacterium]MCP5372222.1 DUF1134 domain-containing protein [Hyphomicrobiales bacterium]
MTAFRFAAALFLCLLVFAAPGARADDGYTQEEIVAKAEGFFGDTTEGLAKAIQRVFEDQGKPNGYITGEEAAGAIGVGLRYGRGELFRKRGPSQKLYWQGPSIGWDLGGNVSKVFVLVYNLRNPAEIFQRFPGVDGSFYIVAGFGVNYQKSNDITLAPIRTGVGLRAGANVGYLHYTKESSWNPF